MNKKTILPHLGRNCPMRPISLALRSPTSRAHARTHCLVGPACQSASAPTKPAISGAGTWVPHGSSTIFIESHQITENRTRTDSVFFAGSARSLTTLPPVILVAVTTAASACYATTQAQDRINTGVVSKHMRGERERERCAAMGDSCMTASSPRRSVAWRSPGRVGASGVIDTAWEALTLWRFHARVTQPRGSATWRRELPCRDNPW
jgi:hypothetical protein